MCTMTVILTDHHVSAVTLTDHHAVTITLTDHHAVTVTLTDHYAVTVTLTDHRVMFRILSGGADVERSGQRRGRSGDAVTHQGPG